MTIPEQVRRQSEAVAKHYAQADTQSETVDDAVATEQEGVGASGSEQADSVTNTAPESAPNEQRRSDTKEEDTYEKRYKTLQGMYNADTTRLRAENQQVNQRIAQLEQLLASLSEPAARPQQAATKLVTEKDIEEYGDSIDVMRRVTEESLSARDTRIAELEQMIRQMQTSVIPRVEQVVHKQAVSSEQQFWSELTAAVPNWKDINADQNFLNWLMEVDPLTGMSRQTYLEDAQRNLDTRRVASFFSTWQGNVGHSVAQSPRDAAASELDRQVAPGRSRGGGAPSKDQAKAYSPKDIQKFFDDVRKGVYRGKEAERDRIERDIFSAQRESRIVANG